MADFDFDFEKDPGASLVYGCRWHQWIASTTDPSATIASSTWTLTGPDAAATIEDQGFTTSMTWVQIAGGTAWTVYVAKNIVGFSNGEIEVETVRIRVREK